MSDIIDEVTKAMLPYLPTEIRANVESAAEEAIEAARPYIIAEYNERLMSDDVRVEVYEEMLKALLKRSATYSDAQRIIETAIQKAGE